VKYFQQPSVMSTQQKFSGVPQAEIQRSTFDRSHGHKTTFDAGRLIPIYVDEVLPGDTFHLKETAFARLQTPLKPVMDNLYYESFYFFVPYRLVWDNWQKFCGERTNPTEDPDAWTIPTIGINMASLNDNSVAAYMGIPQGPKTGTLTVSALPFRAYWLIWNEWFRDQNLQSPIPVNTGNTTPGGEADTLYNSNAPRGKRHDYFTSCLPWPQKGDAVLIPINGALIKGTGTTPTIKTSGTAVANLQVNTSGALVKAGTAPTSITGMLWEDPKLVVDLQGSTGCTINDLRSAFQIQRLLERDARGGTRYIELIMSHFGVRSDDARLQRPEYLAGGSSRITVNPVAATNNNTSTVLADLAGVGTAVNRAQFHKSFTEHGIIIGLANVRADLTYQEGVDRFWNRKTRYDFYWPALAHLGEQAVLNRELFLKMDGGTTDDAPFGYQERFAEYRYKLSRVTGKFNSSNAESLDVWHLALDFADTPVLNNSFIVDTPPVDRIIATPGEPHFLADIWFDLKCQRPMPVYAVPGMSDHF